MRYLTADYTKRINNFHFARTESCSIILPLSIYNNLLSEHCNKVVPKSSSKRVDCKLCVSQSCYEFNFRYEKLLKTHVHFQAKTIKITTFGIKTFVERWTFRICSCWGQQFILLWNIVRKRLGMMQQLARFYVCILQHGEQHFENIIYAINRFKISITINKGQRLYFNCDVCKVIYVNIAKQLDIVRSLLWAMAGRAMSYCKGQSCPPRILLHINTVCFFEVTFERGTNWKAIRSRWSSRV